MLFFVLIFLLFSNVCVAQDMSMKQQIPKNNNVLSNIFGQENDKPPISTQPVNNTALSTSFPVDNQKENIWSKKLQEYIYSYQVRYGSLGDKFVMPEDMEEFLKTLPHGTKEKPAISPQKQDSIAVKFDDEYQQNIVDQYFRMQYRILAPTLR